MKKILPGFLLCLLFNSAQAQVKIGTAGNPHASSVLELDGGTNKGLLLPRMTKANMLAIANPATGLTVYVTDEQAIYLRVAASWIKLNGGGGAFELPLDTTLDYNGNILRINNDNDGGSAIWGTSFHNGVGVAGTTTHGIGIYGSNNLNDGTAGYFSGGGGNAIIAYGRIGVGTTSPQGSFHLNASGISGNSMIINDDADPIIQLQNDGTSIGYFQTNGTDVRTGTNATNNTGSFIVRNNGADRFFVDNAGLVGIGIAPQARLHIDATGTTANAVVINDQDPIVQLENNGVGKGFIQLAGDDIKLGINLSNSNGNIVFRAGNADRVKINSAGHIGIADDPETTSRMLITASPSLGEAHINMQSSYSSSYGPGLRFSGTSPSVRTLGTIETNSGYMELSSGTNATPGGFKFRNGDVEAFRVGTTGNAAFANRLGVGSLSPGVLFHVDGYRGGVNTVAGEIVRIQGSDPTMQFVNQNTNVGFVQVVGNDLKIGTNTNNHGMFVIRTNGSDNVWVTDNGHMMIGGHGEEPPGGHPLAVWGPIGASEFHTVSLNSWPDYVFGDKYKLLPLREIENFINTNKHLPGIPSAAEIEKDGLWLADMQKRMMEKIEELTLHLIEADKKINALTEKINKLEGK